jgi:hypothetical protein
MEGFVPLILLAESGTMSEFVNFDKRGFTLTPGCKDLIDVMARARKPAKAGTLPEAFAPRNINKEHFPSAGLAQLERFVGMLLHSRGEAFVLQIAAQALKSPFVLYRNRTEQAMVIIVAACDVPEEEAVRALFAKRGTEPLEESKHAGTTILVYPLVSQVAAVSALVTELLQEVYALGDDTGLEFEYYEIEKRG